MQIRGCLIGVLILAFGLGSQARAAKPGDLASDPYRYVSKKDGRVSPRVWSSESLEEWLAHAKEQLAALPQDAAADSQAALMRDGWQRRASMLQELIDTRHAQGELDSRRAAEADALKQINSELAALRGSAPPQAPAGVDESVLADMRAQVEALRREQSSLATGDRELASRQKGLPDERRELQVRQARAEKALQVLPAEARVAKTDGERDRVELRLKNARLEKRLADERLQFLEQEEAVIVAERRFFEQQNLLLELRQSRLRGSLEQVNAAQGSQLARAQRDQASDLSRMMEAAQNAADPADAFIKGWQVRQAREQAERLALEQVHLAWSTALSEQKRLRDAEKEELATLENVSEQVHAGRRAGARLRMAYQRIRERRGGLGLPAVAGLEDTMDRYRAQQLEIHDQIQDLAGDWEQGLARASEAMAEASKSVFRVRAAGLREKVLAALIERQSLLAQVVETGEGFADLALERRALLEKMESVVLGRVFWIRDTEPIGVVVISAGWDEAGSALGWIHDLGQALFGGEVTAGLSGKTLIIYLLLALMLVPGVLFTLQRKLRRHVHKRWQPVVCQGQSPSQGLITLILAVLAAAPLAGFVFWLGWWLGDSGWVLGLDLVISTSLMQLGGLIFAFFLLRNFLAGDCLAVGMLGLRPETAKTLHRFWSWVLLGWFLLRLPAAVMGQAPFDFETLPRLALTAFDVVWMIAFLPLSRKASPLVVDLTGSKRSYWWRSWGLIRALILIVLAAILALDLLGYRFGASHLGYTAVLSLISIPLLIGLYRLAVRALEKADRSRDRESTAAPGEEGERKQPVADVRFRRFLKTAFLILGVVVLVAYWGLGSALTKALDEMVLFHMSSAGGELSGVSALDLLAALFSVVVTFWLARNLKGLFDVFIFPRLGLQTGARYAILTITRWTMVVAGFFVALSMIHLDLGKVGWLVAAMGVGIGFGLQEIIANMVSGVILLIERPIRVGDMLTVGEISGEVKRINIRATTIVNFDRQEVIVPNKDFITKEVTNWTLADRVMRQVITIGVAYGSDVDKVRELLLEIASKLPEVCTDPAPRAFFAEHGESSLDFQLFVYLKEPRDRFEVRSVLNTEINKGLKRLGIEIPFPQRDLHVRSGQLPISIEKKE